MIDLRDFPDRITLETMRKKYPVLDVTALEVWLQLQGTAGRLEDALNQYLSNHDLQQSRFFIMLLLIRNPGGLSLKSLADNIGVSTPTMSGLISRMERDGFIHRSAVPDNRREILITISETGMLKLNDVLPEHYKRIKQWMSPLSEAERKKFLSMLLKISSAIRLEETI